MQIRPFSMVQGETKKYTVNVLLNDTPVNITGGKLYFTIKRDYSDIDSNAVLQIITTDLPDAISGRAEIMLPSSQTSSIPPGKYYYDIRLIDSYGAATSLIGGIYTVEPTVTRAII